MMDEATEERVRQRAYTLWQLQGCPNGREKEHWDQAVQEICRDGGTSATAGVFRSGFTFRRGKYYSPRETI